ncbi:MAG: PA2779 family protein [Betaproteobacteria bacterium]|nr:PA2779 family protein [Betaproteobacteria bacterium]
MNTAGKYLIRFLIVTMGALGLPVPEARADLVPTHAAGAAIFAPAQRAGVAAFLERSEVRAQLERYGVDPAQARSRVEALGDDEIAAIAGRIDALPAGGDILGAVVFVFVLLLVTDILGFTRVFPFTRPARR